MKFLEILRARRAELDVTRAEAIAEMEAVTAAAETESRAQLNDDETTAFDAARAKVAEIDTEAEQLDGRIAELASIAERQANLSLSPAPRMPQGTPADVADVDVRRAPVAEIRDRALRVLEGESKSYRTSLRADQLDKVDALVRRSDGDVAARLLITENDDYRSAFLKGVMNPTPAWTPEEARAVARWQEFRAMSEGVDASGGFGIPILIDPSIILTAQGSLNPFRRISRQVTITNDTWRGVSSAGVSWSYDSEGSAASDDSPTLAQPTVSTHRATGFLPYSIEVGADYPNFAVEMGTLLGEGYDELQASAFATGSGSGQPKGIITALDASTGVEVVVNTDGVFGAVDIGRTWVALPDRYKANASWIMSHSVGNAVAEFGNGNNLSWVTVDLTGVVSALRNRPIEFSSYFPELFTSSTPASNVLVVGDFRNYLIADRAGMSIELIPHLFDVTDNRPTGQRGWFAYARHGADAVNLQGFRLLQQT